MDFNTFRQIAHKPKESKKKSDAFYRVERNVSVRISWLLLKIFPWLRPTMVTIVSILVLLFVFLLSFVDWEFSTRIYIGIFQLVLLYSITILDKIDGEVARVTEYCTQKGIYYDRGVHFLYPLIFYFTVGHFFYSLGGDIRIFYFTILLGLLTQMRLFFREASLLVGDVLERGTVEIKDYIDPVLRKKRKEKRPPFFARLLDYWSFMIYAWTLFYYIIVFGISYFYFDISFWLYIVHIAVSFCIIVYRVFYTDPKWGLFMRKD